MGEPPAIRYAIAADGTSLAYAAIGAGERTILTAFNGMTTHVERDWNDPRRRRFYELLSRVGRLIITDRRNMGLSDPGPPTGSVYDIVGDLCSVLDASETPRATLLSVGATASVAIAAAVTVPERIESLVLFNPTARIADAEDYPHGISRAEHERSLLAMLDEMRQGTTRTWDESGITSPARLGTSPGNYQDHSRWLYSLDARAHAPRVGQPTLVIRSESTLWPAGMTDWLLQNLPLARLLEVPGGHRPESCDQVELVGSIEEFLHGNRGLRAAECRLATVMFTDIVGSTELAERIGPTEWRLLLDTHDQLTQRIIERHGGTYVKSTGDGALATFSLPADAVAAMTLLHEALRHESLTIRASAHVGVVEERGDDIAGVAVHVAARILAEAGPGQSVVSQPVTESADPRRWHSIGVVDLKGIAHPIALFRAISSTEDLATPPRDP